MSEVSEWGVGGAKTLTLTGAQSSRAGDAQERKLGGAEESRAVWGGRCVPGSRVQLAEMLS